jgi:serine palmitoyltransferase
LVPKLTEFQRRELDRVPILTTCGLRSKCDDGKERLNFASFNFLGLQNSEASKKKAIETLRKYGVGTCGPTGFYGTLDVHVELEQKLASFIGSENAIVYAQGFSCISSAIPAFAKRGDIIVADESVCFSVQKGIQISRSQIRWFKHNDMDDLERILKEIKKQREEQRLPVIRQFIIVEGLYANCGDVCPLPELIELKQKYKYRLMVDESMSFGTIGSKGAGVCDYYGMPAINVDIIISTLSNSLGAAGGFCAGSKQIIEHQRLSSQAYTYSASLPAILAVAAVEAIRELEGNPELVAALESNSSFMFQKLSLIKEFIVFGQPGNCIIHLRLSQSRSQFEEDNILSDIVDYVT